jgi:DNA-binding FadR family transcriptional regulator
MQKMCSCVDAFRALQFQSFDIAAADIRFHLGIAVLAEN